MIPEASLWPAPTYPAIPVLLECAGVHSGRGYKRAPCLWIVWRFDPDLRAWQERGRVLAADWTWETYLRPIALDALSESALTRIEPDLGAICDRILAATKAEIKELPLEGQARVLATIEHDLSAWCSALEAR